MIQDGGQTKISGVPETNEKLRASARTKCSTKLPSSSPPIKTFRTQNKPSTPYITPAQGELGASFACHRRDRSS